MTLYIMKVNIFNIPKLYFDNISLLETLSSMQNAILTYAILMAGYDENGTFFYAWVLRNYNKYTRLLDLYK